MSTVAVRMSTHENKITQQELHTFAQDIVTIMNLLRSGAIATGRDEATIIYREAALESVYRTMALGVVPVLRKTGMLPLCTDEDWAKICEISPLIHKHIIPSYMQK